MKSDSAVWITGRQFSHPVDSSFFSSFFEPLSSGWGSFCSVMASLRRLIYCPLFQLGLWELTSWKKERIYVHLSFPLAFSLLICLISLLLALPFSHSLCEQDLTCSLFANLRKCWKAGVTLFSWPTAHTKSFGRMSWINFSICVKIMRFIFRIFLLFLAKRIRSFIIIASFLYWVVGCARVHPSSHRVKVEETLWNGHQFFAVTPGSNWALLIQLMCTSLECGRKPECLAEIHRKDSQLALKWQCYIPWNQQTVEIIVLK